MTSTADAGCLAIIETLAEPDREPAIVLWAAQASGLGAHGDIRAWLEGEWDAVAELAHARQRARAASQLSGA